MPKPEQLVLVNEMMKVLPNDIEKAAIAMTDVNDKMLILEAQSFGLTSSLAGLIEAMQILNEPDVFGPENEIRKYGAEQKLKKIEAAIAAAKARLKKMSGGGTEEDDGTGGTTPGVDGEKVLSAQAKLTIARLKKELDALKTKRDTLKEINDEIKRQYDYEQKQRQLQSDAAQAKISGNYIQAAILGQQQLFAKAEFSRETQSIALDKRITTLENRISALTAGARVSAAETALNKAKAKKGYATGGLIVGAGSSMSDSIGAYAGGKMISLSNGEYVMRAKAVNQYGLSTMNAINSGKVSTTEVGGTVYNINMTVNGGSANSQEVAQLVIRELQNKVNKNNKSNRVHI
jgi:hypothetical protein